MEVSFPGQNPFGESVILSPTLIVTVCQPKGAAPMKTLSKQIFSTLFGCRHNNVSRLFTIRRRTYQVCWDCGTEFDYSWERMHRISRDQAGQSYVPIAPAMETTCRRLAE
jgi:hypothetical protein